MDWNLVVGILVFVEGLIILRGLMELSHQIQDGLEELDGKLAGAIGSVVEKFGGGEGFEAPNPIQAAIAELLKNRVAERSNVIEVPTRRPDGRFSKND